VIRLFFLLLLVVPFLEIYTFVKVQQSLSRLYDPGSALLLILASLFAAFVCGKWVIRSYGLKQLTEARDALRTGRVPGDSLLDSLLIVLAGVCLMVPGYLSDAFGLFLLLPFIRVSLRWLLKGWLVRGLAAGHFHVYTAGQRPPAQRAYERGRSTLSDQASDVIDVPARDV
jgi:UPF0716 protein FxsA